MRLLTALTLALLAAPVPAKLPAELEGYRNLKFGMTPAQVQKAIGAARCWEDHRAEHLTRCQRDTGFTVAGRSSSYDLHFLGGKLFRIVVELKLPESAAWPAYSAKYDELRGLFVARHGPPDEEVGDAFVELNAPHRAARWHGPSNATGLWVTASCLGGPPVLDVAYVDLMAMARLGAARAP